MCHSMKGGKEVRRSRCTERRMQAPPTPNPPNNTRQPTSRTSEQSRLTGQGAHARAAAKLLATATQVGEATALQAAQGAPVGHLVVLQAVQQHIQVKGTKVVPYKHVGVNLAQAGHQHCQ